MNYHILLFILNRLCFKFIMGRRIIVIYVGYVSLRFAHNVTFSFVDPISVVWGSIWTFFLVLPYFWGEKMPVSVEWGLWIWEILAKLLWSLWTSLFISESCPTQKILAFRPAARTKRCRRSSQLKQSLSVATLKMF